MTDNLHFRAMTPAELDIAIDWAANEGWNPGLQDASAFLAEDPGGFLMAFKDDEPVASISVIKYGDNYGFLGFYICPPAHRGKGYGYALWRQGMERLAGRTIGLDGVPDQQDNYRQSGFELFHRNVRYGGKVSIDTPNDETIIPISSDIMNNVIAYDRDFFPAPREKFMTAWLDADKRVSLARIKDGEVAGFGTIRACRDGYKIGPLFAETEGDADTLFQALAAKADGEQIFLDPPQTNGSAIALATRYGLEPSFETARMYKGAAPDLPIGRTFGITTFELG